MWSGKFKAGKKWKNSWPMLLFYFFSIFNLNRKTNDTIFFILLVLTLPLLEEAVNFGPKQHKTMLNPKKSEVSEEESPRGLVTGLKGAESYLEVLTARAINHPREACRWSDHRTPPSAADLTHTALIYKC